MNTKALPSSDRFSWHRVGMAARYYYYPLRKALILFPLISLAVGIMNFLSLKYEISIFVSGLLSTGLGFLFYWSPIVLNKIEQSQLTPSLPCRWSERATCVMLISLVVLPVVVLVPNQVLYQLGQYLYTDNYKSLLGDWNVNNDLIDNSYFLSVCTTILPFVVTLFTIFATRKNRVLKAILLSIGALIMQSILLSVIVVWRVVSTAADLGDKHLTENDPMIMDVITDGSITAAYICLGVSAVLIVLTVLRIKTIQIK